MRSPGSQTHSRGLTAPGAFSSLFEAHSRDVLRFMARRCFDSETAVDLTAETFAQAFASRHRFRGKTDAEAQAWLYGIARRQLGKYFRRGYAEKRALTRLAIDVPALTEEDHRRVEDLAGVENLRAALGANLGELSAEQRQALELRVVEERSYEEIAERQRVSEQVVRARVSRALRQLATALEAANSNEGFDHV